MDELLEKIIVDLESKIYQKRRHAADALGEIGDKQAIQPLKTLLEKEQNSSVRKAAEEALEKIKR